MAENLNIIERMARLGQAGIVTFDDDETRLGSITRHAVLAARGIRDVLDGFESRAGELRNSGHFSSRGLPEAGRQCQARDPQGHRLAGEARRDRFGRCR